MCVSHYADVLNGSINFTVLYGPEISITVNETNGGTYDCIAFNDTEYAVSTGYLFVNPVVDDQQAENMSEVTFVCQSSFPSPNENYQWIRQLPYAEPENLTETGQNLIIRVTFDDAGTVYTCVIIANVSGYIVNVSDEGLLTGKTTIRLMQQHVGNIVG